MVTISTDLINRFTESNRESELNGTEFKWGYEVTLQHVLWLIGISWSFASSTRGLFMMNISSMVQGVGLLHMLWTCSYYHVRSCSHILLLMSDLQARFASNTREQIPKPLLTSMVTESFWRCSLFILISELGMNKLFSHSGGRKKNSVISNSLLVCYSSFFSTPSH